MNVFEDIIYKQGKDGRIFKLHWKYRFDPVTLMVAGTAIGAAGSIQGGMAAEAEGKSQQNMANYNAALQEREAKSIEARTALQQKQQAEASDRAQSTMRAGLGASGAVTTAGSPLLIQAEQASQAEMENLMIGYQGSEEALSARSQGKLDIMSGKISRQKGSAAKTAGFMNAGSTLLTGFGTAGYYGGWGKTPGSSAVTGSGAYGGTGGGGPTGGGSRSMIGL
jgi:hypothetical protein